MENVWLVVFMFCQLSLLFCFSFIALYNYKPQKPDEVELTKGGYYTVSEKCQDGWYKGACLRTGRVGVFPGNYVQMVRLSAAMKTSMANAMMASLGTALTSRSNVNRTHSFPKTSPHHKAPLSATSALASSAAAGEPHHHRSASQGGNIKLPSRTITNVTQAQSRGISSPVTSQSLTSQALLLQNQLSPTTTNMLAAATALTSPVSCSPRVSALIACGSSGSGTPNHRINGGGAISRDDSYICSTNAGATSGSSNGAAMASSSSPRAARRHHKRSSAKERSKSTVSSLSQLQNSANLRNTPPPNIVIGAMADENGAMAAAAAGPSTSNGGAVANGANAVPKDKVWTHLFIGLVLNASSQSKWYGVWSPVLAHLGNCTKSNPSILNKRLDK